MKLLLLLLFIQVKFVKCSHLLWLNQHAINIFINTQSAGDADEIHQIYQPSWKKQCQKHTPQIHLTHSKSAKTGNYTTMKRHK